jgi:(4-alkanoyl-5-oxo-2,5-dihydrofuran-3-yl)methyl phosphate reductase
MSNALQWVDTIKSQGKVFNPTGAGKIAAISPYDIAAVAALPLNSSGHEGKAYDLTGSQLLSTYDLVHTLSKVIGSPIQCIDIPTEVAAERMKASGIPENSDSRFSRSLDPDPQRRIYLLRKRSRKADRAAGANL